MTRRLRVAALLLLLFIQLPLGAVAQSTSSPGTQCVAGAVASPSGAVGGVSNTVNTFASNVTSTLGGMVANSEAVGKDLFEMLFAAEIAWFLIEIAWRKRHLADLVGSVGFRLLSTMTFATMLVTVGQSGVVTGIINNFTQVGNYIGQGVNASALGGSGTTASVSTSNGAGTLISTGINMANCIITVPFHNFENESLAAKLGNLGGAAIAAVPGIGDLVMAATLVMLLIEAGLWLLVLLAYLVIVAQFLLALTEGAMILSAGVFLLGFSAARWTMPFAQAYWRFAIGIAMKLFACELVATIGAGLIGGQVSQVIGNSGITVQSVIVPIPTLSVSEMASIFIVSAFVLMLAFKIPSVAQSLISGDPSFNLAQAIETGMMAGAVAGAPLAVAATAAGSIATAGAGAAAAGAGAAGAAGGAGASAGTASVAAGTKGATGASAAISSGAKAALPVPSSGKSAAPPSDTPAPPVRPSAMKSALAKALKPLTNVGSHSAARESGPAGHDLGARHLDL